MRMIALAALGLVAGLAVPASAADVYGSASTKDSPADSSPHSGVTNWTGLYFGGQAGYGISSSTTRVRSTTFHDEVFHDAVPSRCWANYADGTTVDNPNDDRTHDIELHAGASITNVTEQECDDLRDQLGLNNPNLPSTITSGYDEAVAAYTDPAYSETQNATYKTSESGLLGGVRVGYDQAIGRLVVGAFGDYNFSGIDGLDSQWLLAGRLGYIVAPRTMLYGLVGYGQSDYGNVDFGGLTVGGGVEIALGGNVFIGAEYQHAFYDTETLVNTPALKVETDVEEDRILGTLKVKLNGFDR